LFENLNFVLFLLLGSYFVTWLLKRRKNTRSEMVEFDQSDHHQENAYKLIPEAIVILNSENNVIYLNIAAEKMLDCKLRSVF